MRRLRAVENKRSQGYGGVGGKDRENLLKEKRPIGPQGQIAKYRANSEPIQSQFRAAAKSTLSTVIRLRSDESLPAKSSPIIIAHHHIAVPK